MIEQPTTPEKLSPNASTRDAQVVLGVFVAFVLGYLLHDTLRPSATARPTEVSTSQRIDINLSGHAELSLLPGVGPSLAEKIITDRNAHGPYQSVEELHRVPGIGDATMDRLRPWLTINPNTAPSDGSAIEQLERKTPPTPTPTNPGKIQRGEPPINVNTASAAELMRLPGIGPVTAAKIIDTRTQEPFTTADDLRRVKGIGVKTLESVRPFVCVK